MKNLNYISILLIILLLPLQNSHAGQNVIADSVKSTVSFNYGMSFVSKAVWRGLESGSTPTSGAAPQIQPSAAIKYNFNQEDYIDFTLWGSFGIKGNYNEYNFILTYTKSTSIGHFSFSVIDYYFPFMKIPFSNFSGQGKGAHTIEAGITYTAPEYFPISIFAANNIHNDLPGDNSFYIELSHPFHIADFEMNAFIGGAAGKSAWYLINSDKFEVCNIGIKGTRNIRFSDRIHIPVTFGLIHNPYLKDSFFLFKVAISRF